MYQTPHIESNSSLDNFSSDKTQTPAGLFRANDENDTITRTRKSDPMEKRTAMVTLSDGVVQNYADRGDNAELFSIALFYIRFPRCQSAPYEA